MGCPSRFDFLDNAAEVGLIYVRPTYQGRGLGRRLVEAVAAHQASLGKDALMISVLETNAPARGFYEAIGGRVVGTHETEDYGYKEHQVVYGWDDIHAVARSGK
jgi:ribosomal protein S18 acetylase RimI-like enzyme